MAAISISIKGDRELIRTLKRLPIKVARKVVPAATSKAMTPVSKAAKKNVRGMTQGTGLIARSIGKKRKIYRSSGTTVVVVGIRIGFKTKNGEDARDPSKYAHLVEFGFRARGGGFVSPKPFLRNALKQNIASIKSRMSSEIMKGIDKEAKKGTR